MSGSITASCGHQLTEEGFGHSVWWREYDSQWKESIVYATYCTACRDKGVAEGWLFTNEEKAK
jgi:hypothetical protein